MDDQYCNLRNTEVCLSIKRTRDVVQVCVTLALTSFSSVICCVTLTLTFLFSSLYQPPTLVLGGVTPVKGRRIVDYQAGHTRVSVVIRC